MAEDAKVRYEIDLSVAVRPAPDVPDATIRHLGPTDRDALAQLMLDAYVGTIDYEGETLTEAIEEIDSWIADSPMFDHSYGAVVDGQLASAVLTMTVRDEPFIAYVMTDPGHKHTGLGRAVLEQTLTSLHATGSERVVFYITKGNTASERLFTAAGALVTG